MIRCFVIAVRYGFSSQLRFTMLKSSGQNAFYIGKDLFVRGWLNFDPEGGLLAEITSALWRNKVEESLFTFSIVEKIDDITAKRLLDKDCYRIKNKEGAFAEEHSFKMSER